MRRYLSLIHFLVSHDQCASCLVRDLVMWVVRILDVRAVVHHSLYPKAFPDTGLHCRYSRYRSC